MNSSPAHPVCAICNFDLSGVPVQAKERVTCPECGATLRPLDPSRHLTKGMVHKDFLRRFVVPTTAVPTLAIVCALLMPRVAAIFACFYIPVMLAVVLKLVFDVSGDQLERSDFYPRPYPAWTIILWMFLYTLPTAVLHFVLLFILSARLNA